MENCNLKISYDDFANNFSTMIATIDIPHIDHEGTTAGAVGFNIICNNNQRRGYFEYHIESQDMITSNTPQQLVDIAWSNLSSNINDWSTDILTSNSLIGSSFIPQESNHEFSSETNINLTTFNANYIINISNLYVYPTNSPNSWIINFYIKNIINNEYMNINAQVPIDSFSIFTSDITIIDLAWNIIKNQVGNWAYAKLLESPLINTIYIPPPTF